MYKPSSAILRNKYSSSTQSNQLFTQTVPWMWFCLLRFGKPTSMLPTGFWVTWQLMTWFNNIIKDQLDMIILQIAPLTSHFTTGSNAYNVAIALLPLIFLTRFVSHAQKTHTLIIRKRNVYLILTIQIGLTLTISTQKKVRSQFQPMAQPLALPMLPISMEQTAYPVHCLIISIFLLKRVLPVQLAKFGT